ncbi:probable WRKY transcription factor 58 [Macadamia integrifolia]|uniref:probable WRKY transcription factor 58 n=1 Tax=Macadamia integrifolia TaxID=60698 RepID=UPI001C4F38B6|nr:probable WRKY transcription factor 58 [Macadamia integrifolia]
MANPPSTRGAPLDDAEEGLREEGVRETENTVMVIQADGYDWKKYGQKFIKNIGKTRSYFKCQKKNCKAKKRVEWSASNPTNIQIICEGEHTHHPHHQQQQGGSSTQHDEEASNSTSRVNNQYNLYTQFFGDQNNTQLPGS